MITRIRDEISKHLGRALPRLKRPTVARLALELVGVAAHVRTATLVDSVLLSHPDALALALALENVDPALATVYEPVSEQTLVMNRTLLQRRLRDSESVPIFIDVARDTPQILSHPPSTFDTLVSQITSDRPSSSPLVVLELPVPSRPRDLVPLVGFLLDYAVAYSLEGSRGLDGHNCLGGLELVLVQVDLVDDRDERLELFSFSYPSLLVERDSRLERATVVRRIESEIETRIERAQQQPHEGGTSGSHLVAVAREGGGRFRTKVESRLVRLDRVAL